MKFEEVLDIIDQVFSPEGFNAKGFYIKCDPNTQISLGKEGRNLKISFPNKRPSVTIRKIINFSLELNGIVLSETGGTLDIRRFPDIDFDYDDLSVFGIES